MKEYNMVHDFCRVLEKNLENRTGNTFLSVSFTEGARVGFIVAKDCTIVFQAGFNVRKEIVERLATVQKEVDEAVDNFLIKTSVAA